MLRAVRFILVAAILLAIAWWVAGLPGFVTAEIGPYTVRTSTPAAILILVLFVLLLTILLRVLGGLWRTPGGIGAWRGGRRTRLGDIALQRGLVALAAGDAAAARGEAARARKLLGPAPLVLLLNAEAARLSGRDEEAKAAFQALTQDKTMAFLGHRGLLRASLEAGAPDAAQTHALAAASAYPGSEWLRGQRLEMAARQQDWTEALRLTAVPQEVAALATAAAQVAADPKTALSLAQRAVRAQPSLAPAVVTLARLLRERGKPRAAKRALLAAWRLAPQPMLAASWSPPEATALERAQAAPDLAAANPGHRESELMLAQTALAANLPGEARRHAEAVRAAGQDDGRAENILARLDGKPAIAQVRTMWRCTECHAAEPDWTPSCPRCGRIGALRWQQSGTALAKI